MTSAKSLLVSYLTPVATAVCLPGRMTELEVFTSGSAHGCTAKFVATKRIMLTSVITLDAMDETAHVIHKSLRFKDTYLVISLSPVK